MQAPPVITPTRPRFPWLLAGGLMLAAGAAGIVLFLFDPSQYHFYPRCIMYTTTGLLCPGCGSQRALHHLFHGHLLTALRCNLLLVSALPMLAVAVVRRTACWAKRGTFPAVNIPALWIKLAIGAIIVFTMARNIPVAPFNWLTPP